MGQKLAKCGFPVMFAFPPFADWTADIGACLKRGDKILVPQQMRNASYESCVGEFFTS